MRRSSNPTRKISITLPGNLFNELERTLSYSQSRSRFISSAIAEKLDDESPPTIEESTTTQLMAALLQREDIDKTLKALLLHILTK
jgi:metal-responsive CopG/Arc/MetJ family transcriptional regulator